MGVVNILTVINEPNYGACLQGYALYEMIRRLGHSPRMINLSMNYRNRPYSIINRLAIPIYYRLKGYSHCYNMAKEFTNKYMPRQTKEFHSMEELTAHEWNEDEYYIIGSDQVWNYAITQNLSLAYLLSFLPDKCKLRYSYASSFGFINDDETILDKFPIQYFKKFRRIGVREKRGVDFLHRNGVDSTNVIDPTLLLENYDNLINGKVEDKQELLFMALSDSEEQQSFVEEMAKKFGLPIRKIYGYLQPSRSTNSKFLSIGNWLKLIREAELIISDSFHATVFSILMHRQFYVYISKPTKAERIINLLDSLGISRSRIIDNADKANVNDRIDYSQVDSRLASLRKNSIDFLKNIFV